MRGDCGSQQALPAGKRLILHVGQTKAGSTAIQNYLEDQRDDLLGHGILFPRAGFLRTEALAPTRTPGHIGLLHALQSEPEGIPAALTAEMEAHEFHTLVISSESLFFDQLESLLERLGACFADFEITVVAVLRRQDRWLASRYLEEVLSGFRQITLTPADFAAERFREGALDYAGRLEMIAGAVRARAVRLVDYDHALSGPGLIPAFLEVAGLPETRQDLARSLRSNVSPKSAMLIEGKRRLNMLAAGLSHSARLELETQLRKRVARKDGGASPEALPLEEAICSAIAQSNARLVAAFSMSAPLFTPAPVAINRRRERQCDPALEDLVRAGLEELLRLYQQDAAAEGGAWKRRSYPALTCAGSEILAGLLQGPGLSLHLDSSDTAVMAAFTPGAMPVLLAGRRLQVADINRVLGLKLPGEIVCFENPDRAEADFADWRQRHGYACRMVVAVPHVPMARIFSVWASLGEECTSLVLVGFAFIHIQAIAGRLRLKLQAVNGAVCVLVRSQTPATRGMK